MSEEASVTPIDTADQAQKNLNELNQEYFRICASLGEKVYVRAIKLKEINKDIFRLKKINQKATNLVAHQKAVEEAKKATLKVVPNEPISIS